MRLDQRLPALSSFLGQKPAQEIRFPAVGKRLMSPPISDDIGAQVAHPGKEQDLRVKGLGMDVDFPIDRGDGSVEGIDVLEVQLQQKTVVIGHPAAQRWIGFLNHLFL